MSEREDPAGSAERVGGRHSPSASGALECYELEAFEAERGGTGRPGYSGTVTFAQGKSGLLGGRRPHQCCPGDPRLTGEGSEDRGVSSRCDGTARKAKPREDCSGSDQPGPVPAPGHRTGHMPDLRTTLRLRSKPWDGHFDAHRPDPRR